MIVLKKTIHLKMLKLKQYTKASYEKTNKIGKLLELK